jgi:quinol monooxygenase YgiN
VLTHVDVTPPKRPQTEDLLKQLVAASRSDPGVESFDAFRQAGQANHFTLFEVWSGARSFDAHGRAPATIAFRRGIAPLLGALYDERVYELMR